jgi:hypothetical protein
MTGPDVNEMNAEPIDLGFVLVLAARLVFAAAFQAALRSA